MNGTPGTFARVWLTRFKDETDTNKVYALKILRKGDGMRLQIIPALCDRNGLIALILSMTQ